MKLTRREFLRGAGALALAPGLALRGFAESGGESRAAWDRESFSFAHFTDIHIEPELRAAAGTAACFDRLNALQPEFALCGGDLLFDLYGETSRRLSMPVHSVPGNHDVFGLSNQSGIPASDPLYGKKMFEDRIGPRYSAFAYKGWHFLLLDSIGITPQREFIGRVDEEQLAWLRTELAAIGPSKPIIVLTHIPLLSAVLQIVPDPWKSPSTYLVTNAPEVLGLLAPYNVKAVLQGHTHIRENVIYNGCQFLTSGAVCGNWWKGPRCGHPEGFAMVTVKDGAVSWRYETYGFVAVGA
jgi:3',5'-cyclic AMP phosphodiesterase CpdA